MCQNTACSRRTVTVELESNRIVFEHDILRLLCAQGAPLPNWDAGAEMKELGKAEPVWPTVEDPKTETEPKRMKPTQHTGQGFRECGDR